ncbi:hypothetical protein, partial [Microcoleus sp.]|uniref:hypothetical protein n=1 Tax=Microcoleus sp. TaxID=44472 RepID=UPI00403E494D
PIPQEKITLVGWASCPSHQLMKRIFARGLMNSVELFSAAGGLAIGVSKAGLCPKAVIAR